MIIYIYTDLTLNPDPINTLPTVSTVPPQTVAFVTRGNVVCYTTPKEAKRAVKELNNYESVEMKQMADEAVQEAAFEQGEDGGAAGVEECDAWPC